MRRCGLCLGREHVTAFCPLKARSSRHCPVCVGLPHRRPRVGRCRCGERYAEEVVERHEPLGQSSAALWDVA